MSIRARLQAFVALFVPLPSPGSGGTGWRMVCMEWAGFVLDRPLVMGILNVTSDSFSDGGAFLDHGLAIAAGRALLTAGADIVDIGGESTRPGAGLVSVAEEMRRVLPVIEALAADGAVISVDTRNAVTMVAGLAGGARIINDVSGLAHDVRAPEIVAARGCPVVLMHMRGSPMTMNCHAHYADLVGDVVAELQARRNAALAAGIAACNIALDPGLGFAKIGDQNIRLLQSIDRFVQLGHPILIGASRKRFIGAVTGQPDPIKRLPGSLAAGLYALSQGANILRVHDVAETVQAVKMWQALTTGATGSAKGL